MRSMAGAMYRAALIAIAVRMVVCARVDIVEYAKFSRAPASKVQLALIASSFYPDGSPAAWGNNALRAVELALVHERREKWAGSRFRLELAEVFQANGTNSTQLADFVR